MKFYPNWIWSIRGKGTQWTGKERLHCSWVGTARSRTEKCQTMVFFKGVEDEITDNCEVINSISVSGKINIDFFGLVCNIAFAMLCSSIHWEEWNEVWDNLISERLSVSFNLWWPSTSRNWSWNSKTRRANEHAPSRFKTVLSTKSRALASMWLCIIHMLINEKGRYLIINLFIHE